MFKLSPAAGAPEGSDGWYDYPGGSVSKWLAWGKSVCVIPPYAGVVEPRNYGLPVELWSQSYSGDSGVKVSGGMAFPFYIPGSIRTPVEWECCYGNAFRLRTEPAIGHQVARATINGVDQCLFSGLQDIPFEEDRPVSVSVRSAKQSTLAVFCKTYPEELAGGSFSAYKKVGSEWVKMGRYAHRVTGCYTDTELIKLTAIPQNGFNFLRWYGRGEILTAQGEIDPNAGHLGAAEADIASWATQSSIYIKCSKDRTITAWFGRKAIVVEGEMSLPTGTIADYALSDCKYDVYAIAEPVCKYEILLRLRHSKVFAFNGHGSSSALVLSEGGAYGDLMFEPSDAIENIYGNSYQLIYLNSCDSADLNNGGNWKAAFSADAFVGWHGPADNEAAVFDPLFWNFVTAGHATADAVNQTLPYLQPLLNPGTYPVANGTVTLKEPGQ